MRIDKLEDYSFKNRDTKFQQINNNFLEYKTEMGYRIEKFIKTIGEYKEAHLEYRREIEPFQNQLNILKNKTKQ